MKIGREVVALRKFVYDGDPGPDKQYLRGVFIDGERGEAWATTAAIAVAVPLEEKDPLVKTVVPAEVLARIPDGATYPLLLKQEGDVGFLLFDNGGAQTTMQFKTLGQKFPDVRAIMPKPWERPVKAAFNAEYLRAFFDLAARHNRGSLAPVSVEFEAGKQITEAARLTFLLPDGRRVECAVAQVRVYESET